MEPPSQSSIEVLHTITATARSSTMHIDRRHMNLPWSIEHRRPCIPLHFIYIYI